MKRKMYPRQSIFYCLTNIYEIFYVVAFSWRANTSKRDRRWKSTFEERCGKGYVLFISMIKLYLISMIKFKSIITGLWTLQLLTLYKLYYHINSTKVWFGRGCWGHWGLVLLLSLLFSGRQCRRGLQTSEGQRLKYYGLLVLGEKPTGRQLFPPHSEQS